ncbi:hypothetical protein CDCA_CDCA04G1443 [Cyanidium caldarium]|uniref:Uncharacterized protein n=1 Tax=Cyanidium caldarium TaxID=2771 RepID=A0AAV9ITL6_CYACA|nr:hypothetical protein CDCA_CDCA04G1443 [Cyanidium caldarium]
MWRRKRGFGEGGGGGGGGAVDENGGGGELPAAVDHGGNARRLSSMESEQAYDMIAESGVSPAPAEVPSTSPRSSLSRLVASVASYVSSPRAQPQAHRAVTYGDVVADWTPAGDGAVDEPGERAVASRGASRRPLHLPGVQPGGGEEARVCMGVRENTEDEEELAVEAEAFDSAPSDDWELEELGVTQSSTATSPRLGERAKEVEASGGKRPPSPLSALLRRRTSGLHEVSEPRSAHAHPHSARVPHEMAGTSQSLPSSSMHSAAAGGERREGANAYPPPVITPSMVWRKIEQYFASSTPGNAAPRHHHSGSTPAAGHDAEAATNARDIVGGNVAAAGFSAGGGAPHSSPPTLISGSHSLPVSPVTPPIDIEGSEHPGRASLSHGIHSGPLHEATQVKQRVLHSLLSRTASTSSTTTMASAASTAADTSLTADASAAAAAAKKKRTHMQRAGEATDEYRDLWLYTTGM